MCIRLRELLTHAKQHLQPKHHAHQPHIQSGVTLNYVTEFVGHQSLQLLSTEELQGTTGDRYDGILLVPSGCERVDASITGQDHRQRALQARGNGHFVHDVGKALFIEITARLGQTGTHLFRHGLPTA